MKLSFREMVQSGKSSHLFIAILPSSYFWIAGTFFFLIKGFELIEYAKEHYSKNKKERIEWQMKYYFRNQKTRKKYYDTNKLKTRHQENFCASNTSNTQSKQQIERFPW